MARHKTLTDEEMLDRVRPLFLAQGRHARTRDLSAAVGLTWGAIARRFDSKQALFLRAMQATEPADDGVDAGLTKRLSALQARLVREWPQQLQLRLCAPSASPASDGLDADVAALCAALQRQAERGEVRTAPTPEALGRLVLAVLVGHAARRFVQRDHETSPDNELIDTLLGLLAPVRPSHP
jgi:AcrR family transcriptional regulator